MSEAFFNFIFFKDQPDPSLWILTISFAIAFLLISIVLTVFYASDTFRAKMYQNNLLQFIFDPVEECGDNEYDVFISYAEEGENVFMIIDVFRFYETNVLEKNLSSHLKKHKMACKM
jgi:hypothetical protein